MFDPDLADGKPTTLRVVQDKDGNAVGYAIANGDTADDILESFSSLAEVRGRAKQELAAIQDNPFYLVGVIQKKKESAAYKISQAKTSAEKEKLFGDFLKDNPQYASEGMAPQLLRIRGEFGLDGLAGWGGGNTPLVMGRQPNGLVYDPQAEMAKLNATRAEQEETAARLKSQAQGLLDDPNIDVNALLSSTDVPQGLRAALSDNAAAVAKAAATRGRTARF